MSVSMSKRTGPSYSFLVEVMKTMDEAGEGGGGFVDDD